MAQEAHKPMFQLKPADGAIGAHVSAVKTAHQDFQRLAKRIAGPIKLIVPE
jgi:chromosome partitioning protein